MAGNREICLATSWSHVLVLFSVTQAEILRRKRSCQPLRSETYLLANYSSSSIDNLASGVIENTNNIFC